MHLGFWEFVLGVVIISTVGGIITTGMKVERTRLRVKAQSGEAEELKAIISDMHGEISKLKQRVQVLERLATDGDRNLADEIERLRRQENSPGV
jgi:hypothetical protein